MQIIDMWRQGNLVRFALGENGKQWGDDWNDAPYDCNAGSVYSEFIQGYRDMVFPWDTIILEPRDGVLNCEYTREDMRNRSVPCLIALLPGDYNWRAYDDFKFSLGLEGVHCFYFGDEMEPSEDIEIFQF